jgi:hypothetical protein
MFKRLFLPEMARVGEVFDRFNHDLNEWHESERLPFVQLVSFVVTRSAAVLINCQAPPHLEILVCDTNFYTVRDEASGNRPAIWSRITAESGLMNSSRVAILKY